MVVNESALLRAMREDYKGQGYTVARRAENEADPESESILLLSANDWMVEIGWKNVSAKIFGLVAEHMKGLPEVGQAFKVKKKETNTVIFDMVEKFPKHNPDERIIATHRTRLMYESMEVWQEERNNSCMLVQSETAGMLLDHGRIVQWIDGGLLITGRASRIFVRHSKPWISKRNASQRHTFVHSQRGTGFCFSLDGNHFESVGHAEEKAKRDCVNGGLTNGTTCYFEQCGGVDRRTAGSCCHALRDRSGGEDRRQ